MTRYEVEEMANHIDFLEEMLEQWSIDTDDMELELAELALIVKRLEKAIKQVSTDVELTEILPLLETKALCCSDCIKNRLSIRRQ